MDEINVYRFDPLTNGLHLMEIQRRQPVPISGGRHVYAVGGHIALIEVSEAGVGRRIVRTWSEDQPARRFVPGPMPEIASRVASIAPEIAQRDGMSRHERRKAEKLARKRRAA